MSEENKQEELKKEKTFEEEIKVNVEDLKGQNDENNIQKELQETTDRYKRLMAEFENYKKRSSKERDMLYNSVLADIIAKFLPIVDNLEKASTVETKDKNFQEGLSLVLKQIEDTFKNLGVERIETVGKTFDPEVHEAVASVTDDTLGEKEIKQEFRSGYKIGLKVIRHAMVVVAN